MKIFTCIKYVPDTSEAEIKLNPEGTEVDSSRFSFDINDADNYAVEESVLIKEKYGGNVTVVSIGPKESEVMIRMAMAKGCEMCIRDRSGAVLIGGHSVEDDEPKYGLAATGVVDPRQMITSAGARPGDRLFLTKPLGSGIITTAIKGDQLTVQEAGEVLQGMAALNAAAAEAMVEAGASAATDITGFGLLGHLHEMLVASGTGAKIYRKAVPVYHGTGEMAAKGLIPVSYTHLFGGKNVTDAV